MTTMANGTNQRRLEQRLTEACDALWSQLVDPREAYVDDEGVWWNAISGEHSESETRSVPFATQRQLTEIRQLSRRLVATNEFAINGIENRTSYVVGVGHHYRASVRKGANAPGNLEMEVQHLLDQFMEENSWQSRQQEMVRRMDRDGELFLRFFVDHAGITRVRFVEPDQVYTPRELAQQPEASFGIHTQSNDVESVLTYFVDGEPVPAEEI